MHVRLELSGDGWDPHLRDEVRADLASELARDEIALHGAAFASDGAAPPLAVIQIQVTAGEIARIEIRVRDELTDKTVLRELSLGQTPKDARSLEIAVAAEELLQASWAELMLTPRQGASPPSATPSPVASSLASRRPQSTTASEKRDEAMKAPLRAPRVPAHAITAELSGIGSGGGLVWFGGALGYELWPMERVGLGLAIGGLGLVPPSTAEGRVTGFAAVARAELLGRAIDRPCCRLDVLALGRGMVLDLRGQPAPGFEGRRSRNALGELGVGLRPGFAAGPVWIFARAELTATPGGVVVAADNEAFAGHSGLGFAGALGVSWSVDPRTRR